MLALTLEFNASFRGGQYLFTPIYNFNNPKVETVLIIWIWILVSHNQHRVLPTLNVSECVHKSY